MPRSRGEFPHRAHQFLDFSHVNKVFIVGDIHGEYTELQISLNDVGFNPEHDILISVGDLADRGPESMVALEWIKQPWFYRVLGNHDIMPRMLIDHQATQMQIEQWGGDWYRKKPAPEIHMIAAALEDAPVALTVITPKGRKIGVAHADCARDWTDQTMRLQEGYPTSGISLIDTLLWSRYTIDTLMEQQRNKRPFDVEFARVKNIDHVFHGHSILAEPFTIANRSFIDTGMCYGGKFTILDVDAFLDR